MAYTLNTGHALYPNLVELIGVQAGALVSHKTARTFTKHADASYQSGGTYGEALRTVGAGFTAKGASFTPAVLVNTITNPNGTIVVVANQVSATGGGGTRALFGNTASGAPGAYAIGMDSSGVVRSLENYNTNKTLGTFDLDTPGGAHMLAVVKIGETAHKVYADGAFNIDVATRLAYNSSTGAYWDYLGGAVGQGSVAADIVWIAWFDKALTEAELDDLYSSLGANNAFGLVGSSGASAQFAITADDATFSGGAVVSPMASFVVTAADAVFSGGAISGSASAQISASSDDSVFAGAAVGDTSSGSITTPALKNNTGTLLANETGITVYVYHPTTGALVVKKTAQTSNSSGVVSVTDALIVGGTQYRVVIVLASGAEGMEKLTAS